MYLDTAATTPLAPEVLREIVRFLQEEYGNEGSRTHQFGAAARRRVAHAREEVAAVVASRPEEVIFTSGATEANNLAILGLADELSRTGRRHLVTTRIEHKAVLEPMAHLEQRGFELTHVDVQPNGQINPWDLAAALREDTGLVSVMHVNNETGVIQPLDAIAELLPEHSYLHVDAAQGFGKAFGQLENPRVDLIGVSAHKVFGPKGVGALIARRRGFVRAPLQPLMYGGGQQRGLRPGTLPVHLIAGFGTASKLALIERDERTRKNLAFRETVMQALAPLDAVINGDPELCVPNMLNISIPGLDGEAAIVATKDLVAISNGSACTSQRYEHSHVLEAMGLEPARIAGALRLSWWHESASEPPDWTTVTQRLAALLA